MSARTRLSSLIVGAVVTAAALLGVGCGTENEPVAALEQTNDIVLDVSFFPGTGMQRLAAVWEQEHPGVTINWVEDPDFDDHQQRLLADLARAGQGEPVDLPDIAIIELGYLGSLQADARSLTDLRQFGAESLAGDYLDFRWNNGVARNDAIFGLPTDVGGLAVAYRVDLFEQAGLATDPAVVGEQMRTWDDFVDFGSEYVAASGRAFLDSPGSMFEAEVNQLPYRYFLDGELALRENPPLLAAFDRALDAIDRQLTARLRYPSPEWNRALQDARVDGAFATLLAPAWMTGFIQSEAPDTFGLWNIATIPGGTGNWGGSQLVLPIGGEHGEIAFDLIRFLTRPQAQRQIFEESGNFPSTPELYDSELLASFSSDFFNNAPIAEIYTSSLIDHPSRESGLNESLITRVLRDALLDYANGVTPREQVLQKALDDVDALFVDG